MKKKKIYIITLICLVVLIVIGFGTYFYIKNTSKKSEGIIDSSYLGFNYVDGDTYDHVKSMFLANGWTSIIPTKYQNSGDVPATTTPLNPQYPEIFWCSTAIFNYCTVDFQKDNKDMYVWVTMVSTTTSDQITKSILVTKGIEPSPSSEIPTPSSGSLPTKISQCVTTKVAKIENRLQDANTRVFIAGSGSAIEYVNGGYQVSYSQIPAIDISKVGDPVKLCLVSIPKNCPPGDDRGKMYSSINLITNESWIASPDEHSCGGA